MTRRFAVMTLLAILGASRAEAVEIQTVPVGNRDNLPDPMLSRDGSSHGSVSYNYRISTYEVTNAQYAEFLNAVASTDTYALYNSKMGSNPRGGIYRIGTSGSFSYAIRPNMADKPVNWIEPRDAVRFANWLHNGQPTGQQDRSTTEDGAYTIDGAVLTPATLTRNEGAKWFLPSESEWYKAAYYDPRTEAQAGPPGDDHYWTYAVQSDEPPIPATSNHVGEVTNPGPYVANYLNSVVWNTATGNVATVGSAGPSSDSFYGTYDQTGNVWEWTDTIVQANDEVGVQFAVRGGCYDDLLSIIQPYLRPSGRDSINDTYSGSHGLRIATVFSPVDLDGNGVVEVADIDLLSEKVAARTLNTAYDLNDNGVVDDHDRTVWVEDLVGTSFGDSNLDGRFNSRDFIRVFEAGQYEDEKAQNSSWSTGDWNGDAEFDSSDFSFVLERSRYQSVVPEPSSGGLLWLGILCLTLLQHRCAIKSRHG